MKAFVSLLARLVNVLMRRYPSGHMAFMQRRINVDVTPWRYIDVDTTLHRRDVHAGYRSEWSVTSERHPIIIVQL